MGRLDVPGSGLEAFSVRTSAGVGRVAGWQVWLSLWAGGREKHQQESSEARWLPIHRAVAGRRHREGRGGQRAAVEQVVQGPGERSRCQC